MAKATTATYDHPLPDRYGKALAVAEETRDLPEPRVSRDGSSPRRSVRYGLDRERRDRRIGTALSYADDQIRISADGGYARE